MNDTQEQGFRFIHLPQFASWLLQHIDAYTTELLGLFYEADLPLLKAFQHLSEEEKFLFSKQLNIEFLTNLSQNNAAGHIEAVTSRWLGNQFAHVGKLDVKAKDITLINYVRSKAQKRFINTYTGDPEIAFQLHSEIDDLSFAYNTRSINDYLQVLGERIEREEHFSRRIIEASPGITFIFDLVTQQGVYITGRVEEVIGFKPEEVFVNRDFIAQQIHPDDLSLIPDLVQRVVRDKQGKPHSADYRFCNKGGHYQWMRCYAVVYKRNEKGEPLQLLGTAFDVSQEKKTALALQKREQQLLEAQTIGLIGSYEWEIATDKTITTPEVLRILESDRHLTLRDMFRNIHPDDTEKVNKVLAEALISGVYHGDFRYRSKSGMKVIDAKGVVTYDSAGKPRSFRGTLQDITERKLREENLRQNTIDLERSNEQLQQFASIASHDLKEPLRKIGMFTNIIMTSEWDDLPERTRTNIQKISESAARMQQLIEGVLSYSSIHAQRQREKVSLEQLLQDAISNLDYKVKETGAIIISDGLPDADVIPLQMQQLFQNMLSNALKFSRKLRTPEVKIAHTILSADGVSDKNLQPAGYYLQITIADNGIGFNNEAAEKIFGLFQRLHNRSDYEGAGIGLAICKRIVENHGGAITASSEDGVGAAFTITLPYWND